MAKYLLVGNPTARSGKGLERIDLVLATMRQIGLDVTFLRTEPEGRTVGAVARAVDGGDHDVVIYTGGDGTFAEVAKGLLAAERKVPMGLMPGGTANDQGKSFGIGSRAEDVPENVQILTRGHTIRMDVGRVTRIAEDGTDRQSDLWFDNMGFGLAPAILATRNRDRELVGRIPLLREVYRDQAVYAGAMIQEAIRSVVEPVVFDAEVVVDGRTHHLAGLTDIVLNNTPVFGGEWIPVRTARADDGQLDLVPMEGRRELIASLVLDHKAAVAWDLPGVPMAPVISGAAFDITLLQPRGGDLPCQIDGEEWHAGTHFRVEVLAGALPVIVRADWTPPWWPRTA